MMELPYVKSSHLEIAQAMEDALFRLPDKLVMFVGVKVDPTYADGENPTYRVTVGCSTLVSTHTCSLAVHAELLKRWKDEKIDVVAFHGRVRTN